MSEEAQDRRRDDQRLSRLEDLVARHDERLRQVNEGVHEVKGVLDGLSGKFSVHVAREEGDRTQLLTAMKELKTVVKKTQESVAELNGDFDKLNTDFERRGAFVKGIAWLGGVLTTAAVAGPPVISKLFKGE